MHGTGAFNSFNTLQLAGSVTTLSGRRLDVIELLDTIERERINSLTIVGDAFAKPMVAALDAEPGRWDISHLRVIVSSGIMWSSATKAGLLRHNARLILVDALGSSEAIGMATATTTADTAHETARFKLGPSTRVLTEDGRDVVPGSGERGRVALGGRMPLGYYKDDAKTLSTFQVVDGVRYSIPGDWAEVDAEGNVKLLGRGSQVINTGGEKVYPAEVEEVLLAHPAVADAGVIGVPHPHTGEAVKAFVVLAPGASIDEEALIDHCRDHLARYKSPGKVLFVDELPRSATGKLVRRDLVPGVEEPPAQTL
jgi:acyl-coenzyme A synthetase/AMP-(fatty) acid ligase